MYRQFFGLELPPFDLTSDLRFLFLTPGLREALSNLQYGMFTSKGLVVLVGEAGTGKTTIIRAFLASRDDAATRCIYIGNPSLTRAEFYELLAHRMGLSAAAAASKTQFLIEAESACAERPPGSCPIVIIDEAQTISPQFLEEVRLLTNLETERGKLISIVLSGQQELAERLEEPAFRALKQRVALRCELTPFDLAETAGYIAGRIRIAGGNPARVFTRDAVVAIHEFSRGIARTVSVICDNALLAGFASDTRPVDDRIVLEVCRDLRLEGPRGMSRAPKPGARPSRSARDAQATPANAHRTGRLSSLFSRLRRLVFPTPGATTLDIKALSGREKPDETVET